MSAPVGNSGNLGALQNPCGGSSPSQSVSFGLTDNSSKSVNIDNLLFPLRDAIALAQLFKSEISRRIDNSDFLQLLDSQNTTDFPAARKPGSGQLNQLEELLKEDYKTFSQMYVFIEEARGRRTANDSLEKMIVKLLNILCQMNVSGILTNSLQQDLSQSYDIRQNSAKSWNRTTQNFEDYKMINSSIKVLESVRTEYERLKLSQK